MNFVPGSDPHAAVANADYGWAGRESQDRAEYPVLARWVPEGARVLDVGCGDGRLGAKLIAERRASVSGFEIDPGGTEKARAAGVEALTGDADHGLPYADNGFDVAILNVTLMMVYRPRFVLQEMLRVAPVALVSFPNLGHWVCRAQLLAGRFPTKPLYGSAWYDTRHIHLFTWADLRALVRLESARITAVEHFGRDSRTPSPLARAWPNLFSALSLARIERAR